MFKVGDKVLHKQSGQIGVVQNDYETKDEWCLIVVWLTDCDCHTTYSKDGKVWLDDPEPTIRLRTPLDEFLLGVPHEEDT